MKKQRYIVEIEMPDGDFISAGWLKDIIQTDCDVEDESRKKVTVQEASIPSNLDEAANNYGIDIRLGYPRVMDETDRYIYNAFKAGAEWMAGQGVSMSITDETEWADVDSFVHKNVSGNVILQIRKNAE